MPRLVTLAALWLVATALAGGVTWAAVAWSEKEPVGGVDLQRPMTDASVRRTLAELGTPTPTPTPTPAPQEASTRHPSNRKPDSPRSRRPRPRPVLQTGSWQVAGGSVAAGCRADQVELLYAAPTNGWAYHLEQETVTSLTVRFTRSQAASTLRLRCSGGAPVEVSATSSGREPTDSDSGD